MIYCDAHIHLPHLSQPIKQALMKNSLVCTASHSIPEWEKTIELIKDFPNQVFTSFGIHPQNPDPDLLPFLEEILKSKDAPNIIGEIGFDLFNENYKKTEKEQENIWNVCLDLAIKYKKPILIHSRKAMHKIFADFKKLKKLSSVIFHSFPGSPIEAHSFLEKGVNAYFSFGKPFLNGHKNAIGSLKALPLERILLETDAPYQTLKGENETKLSDIQLVYEKAAFFRDESIEKIAIQIEKNFKAALGIF